MEVKEGFHADTYLLKLVDLLVEHGKVTHFIETGTYEGRTLSYFGGRYPDISCYSCEPDPERSKIATNKCASLPNIRIYNIL
mgnify:FL=1